MTESREVGMNYYQFGYIYYMISKLIHMYAIKYIMPYDFSAFAKFPTFYRLGVRIYLNFFVHTHWIDTEKKYGRNDSQKTFTISGLLAFLGISLRKRCNSFVCHLPARLGLRYLPRALKIYHREMVRDDEIVPIKIIRRREPFHRCPLGKRQKSRLNQGAESNDSVLRQCLQNLSHSRPFERAWSTSPPDPGALLWKFNRG